MQQEILAKNSQADLKVYAVWFNMMPGDSRGLWDSTVINDPRVSQLWDEQKSVGTWFGQNLTQRGAITWDYYALFAPDATWSAELSAPLSSGGTIVSHRDQLKAAITPLIAS